MTVNVYPTGQFTHVHTHRSQQISTKKIWIKNDQKTNKKKMTNKVHAWLNDFVDKKDYRRFSEGGWRQINVACNKQKRYAIVKDLFYSR